MSHQAKSTVAPCSSNIPISSISRIPVPTVNCSTQASEIASLMVKHNIGAVIVVRDSEPIGIVTERDLVRRIIYAKKDPEEVVAQEIMTAPLISISNDRSVEEALAIMQKNRVRRLVVFCGDSKLGLLTERRLLRTRACT
jgi:CBS domain-containing protein